MCLEAELAWKKRQGELWWRLAHHAGKRLCAFGCDRACAEWLAVELLLLLLCLLLLCLLVHHQVVVVIIGIFCVGVLNGANTTGCRLHPCKAGSCLFRALVRARCVELALCVEAGCPLLHGLLVLELDDKVLDARVALPPDLDGVGAWAREEEDFGNISHKDATLKLQLGVLVPNLGSRRLGLVLLVLALVGSDLLAAEQDALEQVDLVVLLLLAFAGDHSVDTMLQEFTELVDTVVLPVVDAVHEILEGLVEQIAVDSLVCLLQCALSGSDTCVQVEALILKFALLAEILQEQRVLDETLHGLEQETVEGVEIAGDRVVGGADLVKVVLGELGGFALVGDKGLVDVERVLKCDKRVAPLLVLLWYRVGRLNADEEAALDVENGIDVEENLVDDIAVDNAPLLERLLEVVQVLEILDVLALGVDELTDNVVAVAELRGGLAVGFFVGRVLGLQQEAALLGEIEDVVDNSCDL